ncbi:hypothetical protein SynBIOSE41_01898 [Synechococcus sp. BIOS-E4-1]|nr:hypothetical protein SynBIOSE41_01898 [Synechococcus sp. BIOS-E4-1]
MTSLVTHHGFVTGYRAGSLQVHSSVILESTFVCNDSMLVYGASFSN